MWLSSRKDNEGAKVHIRILMLTTTIGTALSLPWTVHESLTHSGQRLSLISVIIWKWHSDSANWERCLSMRRVSTGRATYCLPESSHSSEAQYVATIVCHTPITGNVYTCNLLVIQRKASSALHDWYVAPGLIFGLRWRCAETPLWIFAQMAWTRACLLFANYGLLRPACCLHVARSLLHTATSSQHEH